MKKANQGYYYSDNDNGFKNDANIDESKNIGYELNHKKRRDKMSEDENKQKMMRKK